MVLTAEQLVRFFAKVDRRGDDECWEWTAGRFARGYGAFQVGRRACRAHRLSWEIVFGPIPPGLCALHRCDNPPCVNPAHLFLGTKGDNNRDAARKGRSRGPSGEMHGHSKLTEFDVIEIRRLYRSGGISQCKLAAQFGVGQTAIGQVTRGRRWRHVP